MSLGKVFGSAFKSSSKSKSKSKNKEIANPRHPKPDTSKMDPKAAKKTNEAWRRNELNGQKRGFDHQGYANKSKLDRIGGHGGTQLGIGVAGIGVTAGVMAATSGGGQATDPNAGGQQAVDPNAPPPDPSLNPPNYGNASVQSTYADSGYGGSPYASPGGSQYGSTNSFSSAYPSPAPLNSPGSPVYDPNLNGGRGGMTQGGGYMP